MKHRINILILAVAIIAPLASATSNAIKELTLDEQTVYTIPVSLDRVTTIRMGIVPSDASVSFQLIVAMT